MKRETTDEAWIDLISEEDWKQYYEEMLVRKEEKSFQFDPKQYLCKEMHCNQYGEKV